MPDNSAVPTPRTGLQALAAGAPVGIDKMPALRGIIDRIAPFLAETLQAATATPTEVAGGQVRALRFCEALSLLTPRALLAVLRADPWKTRIFASLDGPLIGALVQALLGGPRDAPAPALERPWTAIERSLVERLASDAVAIALSRAFAPVAPVQFTVERLLDIPLTTPFARPDAGVIVTRCGVTVHDVLGHIYILLPAAALEPAADLLAQAAGRPPHDDDPLWRTQLQAMLPHLTVTLRAVIEQRMVSAADIVGWRPGSKLMLDRRHDEPIDVLCSTLLVFRSRMAEKEGRIALHIDERRLAEDWPS